MKNNAFGIIGPNPSLINIEAFKEMIEDRFKGRDIVDYSSISTYPYISPVAQGASEELLKNIHRVARAADLVLELFGSKEEAVKWMKTPNNSLMIFGLAPSSVIMASHGEPVIEWLETRLGLRKGAGF